MVRLVPGKGEEHVADRELTFAQGFGDFVEAGVSNLAKRG